MTEAAQAEPRDERPLCRSSLPPCREPWNRQGGSDMPPASAEMWDSDYSSDEEISTKKEQHSRLGEDNLDDTLEYDFSGPALRRERLGSQKPLMRDSNQVESEDARQPGDRK